MCCCCVKKKTKKKQYNSYKHLLQYSANKRRRVKLAGIIVLLFHHYVKLLSKGSYVIIYSRPTVALLIYHMPNVLAYVIKFSVLRNEQVTELSVTCIIISVNSLFYFRPIQIYTNNKSTGFLQLQTA